MKRIMTTLALLLALLSGLPGRAAEGDAYFAVSPESAYALLEQAIRDAKETIELNIYMLTNRSVAQALADRAQKDDIRVTILLEGEIFGGEMLKPVKRVLDDLYLRFDQQSQGRGRFLVMTGQGGKSRRRYVFNHAKYMVIDGKKAFVSSENITGSAYGNKNLSGGTRGWEIYLEDAALAASLQRVFREDSDESRGDVVPYQKAEFKVKDPGNSPLPKRDPRKVRAFPVERGKAREAGLCVSPRSLDCVLAFIRGAKRELWVEHLSLPRFWAGAEAGSKKESPIVQELLGAARRGVKVRVLLNDDSAFGDGGGARPEERNSVTVSYLKTEAERLGLPLEAALFRPKAVEVGYLHNKGMVADGSRVFVGSINGTENSVMNNREVAVSVSSVDAAAYFGAVFHTDWSLSLSGN